MFGEIKWILPIVSVLCFPIANLFITQYNTHYYECEDRHDAYKELLKSKHCVDLQQRIKHQNAGTVDCLKAEKELKFSIRQCAVVSWWKDFELVHLYNRMFGSYFKILGIVLPIVMFTMYLLYSYISNKHSEDRMYNRMSAMIEQVKQPVLKPTSDAFLELNQ